MSRLSVCGSRARSAAAPAWSIGAADPRYQVFGVSTWINPSRANSGPRITRELGHTTTRALCRDRARRR